MKRYRNVFPIENKQKENVFEQTVETAEKKSGYEEEFFEEEN